MKAKLLQIIIIILCLSLVACQKAPTANISVPADTTKKNETKADELQTDIHSSEYFDCFDTVIVITGNGYKEDEFQAIADKIHARLFYYHQLFDIYHTYPGLNNLKTVNDAAGKPDSQNMITVDPIIIKLLKKSLQINEITLGNTNVLMGSVLRLWHDKRTEALEATDSTKTAELPDINELKKAAEHVDINSLVIDETANKVGLTDNLASIDVGAITKGFVADEIVDFVKENGYKNILFNIGGNVKAGDSKTPNGKPWVVAIQHPDKNSGIPYVLTVNLQASSLVTSGIYERYYTVGNKNYHHIINPHTLFPAEFFQSVSVLTFDSALADGLTTGLFSMPLKDGLKLIESLPDVEAMWIDNNFRITYSSKFENYIKKKYNE